MTHKASLPPQWGRLVLWCLFAAYLAFIAVQYREGHLAAAAGERPVYTDFTPTYAAALLLREHPPQMLYHHATLRKALLQAAHAAYPGLDDRQARAVGFAPWQYPPSFIFAVAPLGQLAYYPALAFWLVLTSLPFLAAMRGILPAAQAVPLALAAPPTFYNLMFGQTGFLSAGLIALGLLALRRRPLLAGILIGLASIKPHLGILLPFALAAGAHWRAFISAMATVTGLIAFSIVSFGPEPWYAFIGTLEFQRQGFEVGAYSYKSMVTVLSAARLGGLSLAAASWLQAAASAALLLAVVLVWRSRHCRTRPDLQYALLCFATPLVLPMAYLYDLVLIVPGIAWLLRDMQTQGYRRAEPMLLAAAVGALLPSLYLAKHLSLQVAPLCLLLLAGLVLHRLYRPAQ